jgi:uncharacterized membrane protein YhaH (DUF805 family)
MDTLALLFSPSGRIAPKPFAIGIVCLYIVSFGSRLLLAQSVMARAGVGPFVLVQIAVIWSWYALHAKRLHDAARGGGAAIAVAINYALAIVVVAIIAMLFAQPTPAADASVSSAAPSPGLAEVLLVLYLFALLTGDPHLGLFGYVLVGLLVLVLAPFVIALVFSVWTGTRPRVATAP